MSKLLDIRPNSHFSPQRYTFAEPLELEEEQVWGHPLKGTCQWERGVRLDY